MVLNTSRRGRRNGKGISKEAKADAQRKEALDAIAAEAQELKLSNNPWLISRPFWTPPSSTPLR